MKKELPKSTKCLPQEIDTAEEARADYGLSLFDEITDRDKDEFVRQRRQNTWDNIDKEPWQNRNFAYPERKIRLATSFSGIGAIEHAFHRLGLNHEIVFAGDIEPNCKKSYFANYPICEERWHNDIHNFDATPYLGQVDLFVGGAPCQAFSMVGKRRGFEDTRGTLFREFARVVKECQPKVFIFENVRGLLNHDSGNTWEVIRHTFEDYCGYQVYFQVLNSKDYGIPQHRERIFCIGFKEPTSFLYPKPVELQYEMYDFLEDYIDTKYFLREKGIKFVTSHKNRLKCYTQINGDVALCQKRNQQFNWHGDFVYHPMATDELPDEKFDEFIFDVKDVEEKYYLSEKVAKYVLAGGTKNFKTSVETDLPVARPLLQSMHKMHRAGVDNYVTHKGRIRKLTPRECLRLMGFKDNFKIVVSDTAMYQQAGNSIVVDVLIALLKQLDITQYGIEI
ncbi:MAG: DNA (cytosine-5-)-methyltransferase [Bacteroidales bacterium]|nr:DNA (cytosine-5-)-methyltransferase [Bacteroidales bacterium]MCF0211667.1 DNA (cytosine-5-)-methyltransferase [Bacteroidales bacterium]